MTVKNRDTGGDNGQSDSATSETAQHLMIATRVFDAPRDLVFEVWTEPAHIGRWWGPKGFTTTTYAMDVRPGGVWRYCMHGPDGRNYENEITYLEIARPERIVYKHLGRGDGQSEPVRFVTTATFEDLGGKTRVSLRMKFPSAATLAMCVEKYGAKEGLEQHADRMGEYAAALAAKRRSSLHPGLVADRELVITRTFDAPRAFVYRAWTDPAHLAQWWGPHGFTNPVCEFDAGRGGRILIHMAGPDGTLYPMTGVVHEVVENAWLVFGTSALPDEQGLPQLEALITVTFVENAGRTTMTLRTVVTKATAKAAPSVEGMDAGWPQSLERLGAELAGAATR